MKLASLALLVAAIFGSYTSFQKLKQISIAVHQDQSQIREVMYLPKLDAVRVVSFGYRTALSNILWFVTTNYFGKHYREDHDYRWLNEMCKLVTELNPKKTEVFEFCGTMLAWELQKPEEAIKLLTSAIEHNPEKWEFYYQRGFNYQYFVKDNEKAAADFMSASKLPGVHPVVVRLAGKKLAETENADQAIEFLNNMLEVNKDPAFQAVINDRIKELQQKKAAQEEHSQ